eukprot:TRINITY_DN50759_c0_g1_i1.p1 TRINITY_DN50759_c0_g1~~TRINITY_DN50759_c0_g1_i1.p1  ORF type:complete len:324 (-),score=51.39 TRINITY_DN50759_c0_g1_i1:135-1055(-)
MAPSSQPRKRGFAALVTVTLLIAGCNWFYGQLLLRSSTFSSLPMKTVPDQRRHFLLGSSIAAVSPFLYASPPSANAEETQRPTAINRGYQLKLPTGWASYRQNSLPGPDETRTKELLLAGNPDNDTEVKILRVPLVTSPQDPQGLLGLALSEYFLAEKPRVTRDQILPLLTTSFAQQPATFNLTVTPNVEDKVRAGQRYLLHEFDLERCDGQQIQSRKGKICQQPNGELLATSVRHHAILNTVTSEPGGEAFGGNYPQILWIVDISAPLGVWPKIKSEVNTIVETFTVGSETALEAYRNATAPKFA